jgi:hypothetical protein
MDAKKPSHAKLHSLNLLPSNSKRKSAKQIKSENTEKKLVFSISSEKTRSEQKSAFNPLPRVWRAKNSVFEEIESRKVQAEKVLQGSEHKRELHDSLCVGVVEGLMNPNIKCSINFYSFYSLSFFFYNIKAQYCCSGLGQTANSQFQFMLSLHVYRIPALKYIMQHMLTGCMGSENVDLMHFNTSSSLSFGLEGF